MTQTPKGETDWILDFCSSSCCYVSCWGGLFFVKSRLHGHKSKGQLIWKCPFGFIVWTKIPTKLFLDFCPEFFCSFLGASWKLFGLPGDLVCNIINKEACRKPQKASRKPPGRYKKFQGRNSEIISLVILSKLWNQRDILKLTDL